MSNNAHGFSPLKFARGFVTSSSARAIGIVGALALVGTAAGIGIAFDATVTRSPLAVESVDAQDVFSQSTPSPSSSGNPAAESEAPAADQSLEGEPAPEGQASSGGVNASSADVPAPPAPESVPVSAPAPAPDTTPPVISVGNLPAVIAVNVGCPASGFVVTATDESGVASVEVTDDHPDIMVSQYWRDGDRFEFEGIGQWPTQFYYSAGGAQVVTVVISATDNVGNRSSITRTFNYYDYSRNCDET